MPLTMEQIEQKLESIKNLPTLPVIATTLLEMLENKSISMNAISRIMENDPPITTKVLKIANSAYYSLRKRVDTIRMALIVLGVNEITNIILGLSVFKSFEDADSSSEFDLPEFWRHCIVTSQIARYLAKTLNIKTHGEEFTAGLIHDIGKIIFFLYFKEEFYHMLLQPKDLDEPVAEREKRLMGATHMQVGAWLAAKWRIPKNLIDCILYHHAPSLSLSNQELVSLINLGDYYSKAYQNKNILEDFSEFRQLPGWDVLKAQRFQIDIKTFYPKLKEEIAKADDFAGDIMLKS